MINISKIFANKSEMKNKLSTYILIFSLFL